MKNLYKLSLIPLSILMITGCNKTSDSNSPPPVKTGYNITTLTYKKTEQKNLQLDLYLPNEKETDILPLVVWVHGGAWFRGSKDEFVPKNGTLVNALVKEGYAIAAVNYRLSGDAIFPAPVADINDAINYLVDHSNDYGIDAKNVGMMGRSAGGHLASLIATSNNDTDTKFYIKGHQPKYTVAVVLDFFGPSDINAMRGNSGKVDHDAPDAAEAKLLGASPIERPDLAEWASSTTYIDANTPPFIIMHGANDQIVPDSQSKLLKAKLDSVDIPNKLIIVTNARHGDPVFDTQEYVNAGVEFIKQYLPVKN